MKYLIDKLLIFILCLTLMPEYSIDTVYITAVLFIVAISCFGFYAENSPVPLAISCLYCLISIFIPVFALFLPVAIYGIVGRRKTIPIIISIVSLCLVFKTTSLFVSCAIAAFSAMAVLLEYRTGQQRSLGQKLKEIRDSSTELKILLENKNHDLLEKQDYEIYMATLQERNRIAREIHDNVGHMITRSILQIGALKATNNEPSTERNLIELNETLNNAMTSIRNSVHDLHEESIDLHSAINELIEKTPSQNIFLEYDFGTIVPKNIKFGFIAIIKEALNNISKHSNATKVTIVAREHPGFYQLLIEDNGTNISSSLLGGGIGLSTMKERVVALKGSIKISTDKGFKIFISIMKEA
ncbi:MAG: histidine kinase [Oscillospiraceae bacterium]|nr:histidine kinase [Oscillospiraceae bacterium]